MTVTERNVALQTCREVVFHRTGSHVLQQHDVIIVLSLF